MTNWTIPNAVEDVAAMDKDEEKEYQYSEKYDAFYDAETNQWVDSKCSDPTCEYCRNRPERPLNEQMDEE